MRTPGDMPLLEAQTKNIIVLFFVVLGKDIVVADRDSVKTKMPRRSFLLKFWNLPRPRLCHNSTYTQKSTLQTIAQPDWIGNPMLQKRNAMAR